MAGYQVMPRLTPEEYADLEQDIIENGVQVPIMVSPGGKIIDGHHRDEIARKHDLHCPRRVVEGDDLKLRSMAYSLNLHRRHLNREQKRELIARSLLDDPQLSNREHARRTGSSTTTVGTVRDDMEDEGRLSKLDSRVSSDGRVRPVSQPPRPTPKPRPKPEPVPDPVLPAEPETANDPLPEWKDVGTIPTSRLDDVAPKRSTPPPAPPAAPAPGITEEDLDELNATPPPAPAPDDTYHDHADHLTKMMAHLRKAASEVKEVIYLAQHIDFWDKGPLSADLRELLDELDNTLASGGFNAELARLMEEGNQ